MGLIAVFMIRRDDDGKGEVEGRSFPNTGVKVNIPIVTLNDRPRNTQPQSSPFNGPFVAGISLAKPIENCIFEFLGYANSSV